LTNNRSVVSYSVTKETLILFSVRRTDRSNAKFANFSSGKTDNARRRRAADILPLSLSEAELVSRHCSHWHFQTYPVGSRRSGGTKM